MKSFVTRAVLPLVVAATICGKDTPPPHPDNSLVDGWPLVSEWSPPVYPADALKEKIGGTAIVRIVVDEAGRVGSARALNAPDPRLGEAAVAALKKWTFHPAIEGRKPVPMCVDVPLPFDAAKGAKSWPPGLLPPQSVVMGIKPPRRTAASVKSAPFGDYPATLAPRRLAGSVVFACMVDPEGHASMPSILGATHADFVLPALASFAKWEFTPAMQGDLPVGGETRGEITFEQYAVDHDEQLAANEVTAPDGSPPSDRPILQSVVDPVWPYDLLLKGEGGMAMVEFTVKANGSVADIKVSEASHPDFGRAVAAALEGWNFQPATRNGQGVTVSLMKRAEFKAVPVVASDESSNPLTRLVLLARADAIRGGAGLDEKVTPLYRVIPIYPAVLQAGEKPAGQAVIEFVIDRDGRARLPRIISATHIEFGWAAATAAAQWVFKAPLRDGQPTEVKVRLPFQFAAPAL